MNELEAELGRLRSLAMGVRMGHAPHVEILAERMEAIAAAIAAAAPPASSAAPIDMVLHCPACGKQHIDAPEPQRVTEPMPWGGVMMRMWAPRWTNPPHRSHLCHGCGYVWRPADVPTNGVAAVKTRGKNDTPKLD